MGLVVVVVAMLIPVGAGDGSAAFMEVQIDGSSSRCSMAGEGVAMVSPDGVGGLFWLIFEKILSPVPLPLVDNFFLRFDSMVDSIVDSVRESGTVLAQQ